MHAKWLKERFPLDWPGQNATLAGLRARIADLTHLNPTAFKLIHAGAVMKDDSAPLSAYSLSPHSTIVVVGHDNPLSPPPPSVSLSLPSDEQLAIANIHAELASVRKLAPDVHEFLATLSPSTPTQPSTSDHTRLGELLLQCLLRLDAIDPERDWSTARAERKAAVKETQQLLDSLDSAWAAYSSSP